MCMALNPVRIVVMEVLLYDMMGDPEWFNEKRVRRENGIKYHDLWLGICGLSITDILFHHY